MVECDIKILEVENLDNVKEFITAIFVGSAALGGFSLVFMSSTEEKVIAVTLFVAFVLAVVTMLVSFVWFLKPSPRRVWASVICLALHLMALALGAGFYLGDIFIG